jgi:hypothetical protein
MYAWRGLGRGGSSKRERAGAYGPGLQCAAQYCTDGDGAAIDRLSPSIAGAAFYTYRNRGRRCEVFPIGQRRSPTGRNAFTSRGAGIDVPSSLVLLPADSIHIARMQQRQRKREKQKQKQQQQQSQLARRAREAAQPRRMQPNDPTCHARCDDAVMADPLPSPCRRNPGPHRLPLQAGARRSALRDARLPSARPDTCFEQQLLRSI